ncbi:hypothetical protein [Microbacterium sp. SD291]|uniref:hypothetical protein n=1 Tax=Microbacterium sp. SD291 TaxID=2782007 RepID=UPI001A960B68|nr:hypothetical protein [Microbacterium sp. SD291]MBO0980977.1 hypothetical protein [Microbacterium sp. SD291]
MDDSSRSVRAVYVVLSHRNWAQVRRLAGAILVSSPEARVIIAHDARAETFPVDAEDERIDIFAHGLACDWGSWELVDAALRAFDRARTTWDPQLICLISGQDYPMRHLPEWEQEAITAPSWIGEARPLRYRPRWGRRRGRGDDRYTRYAYRWFRAPFGGTGLPAHSGAGRFAARVRRALALHLEPVFSIRFVERGRGRHYGIRRLRVPFTTQTPCYLGSQWLAVRRPEVDALLDHDFARGTPLRRLYRRSVIPDESALVTPLSWRSNPSSLPPVSLSRWDPDDDETVTWTLEDLPMLLGSGSPFCRKVDPDRSAELMDALDEVIAGS